MGYYNSRASLALASAVMAIAASRREHRHKKATPEFKAAEKAQGTNKAKREARQREAELRAAFIQRWREAGNAGPAPKLKRSMKGLLELHGIEPESTPTKGPVTVHYVEEPNPVSGP